MDCDDPEYKKSPELWGLGALEGGLSMKERSPLGDSVQSGDLQDLDVLGVDLEVRGQ